MKKGLYIGLSLILIILALTGVSLFFGLGPFFIISRLYKTQIYYRIIPSQSEFQNRVIQSQANIQVTDEMKEKMKTSSNLCYTHSDCSRDYEPSCNGPRYNNYYEGKKYITLRGCEDDFGRERVYFCEENKCTVKLYSQVKDIL